MTMKSKLQVAALLGAALLPVGVVHSQVSSEALEAAYADVADRVVNWRRHIHENPELSNREFKTAALVAEHLRSLGLEVQTGVAHTGVVGILRGSKPGPVVGLRADMDALPVEERVDLPFHSRVVAEYLGEQVPVMHACGHDTHVAILMGVAEVLAKQRDQLRGTVKFVFQPAEEGAPPGEKGGAELMIAEGVLDDPAVDVMFGLHIGSQDPVGKVGARPGGVMASVDDFRIIVRGKQAHGAYPWLSVDPIVTAAQLINQLQTIVSRNAPLLDGAAVITVGSIHGGVRSNIIPEEVELKGTVRALDPAMREVLLRRIREVVQHVAAGMGAEADLDLPYSNSYPVTYNDPALAARATAVLSRTLGADQVFTGNPVTGAEDFSFFGERVPSFFFRLGGRPADVAVEDAPAHHTPYFFVDEAALPVGVRAMTALTLDYLES